MKHRCIISIISLMVMLFICAGSAFASWERIDIGTNADLKGIWGSSDTDIYVVGTSGTVVSYDGSTWSAGTIGEDWTLYDVYGTAADNVYAVGEQRGIFRNQGTGWNKVYSTYTNYKLRAISGPDSDTDRLISVGKCHTIWAWFVPQFYNIVDGSGDDFDSQEQHSYNEDLYGAWTAPNGDTIVVGEDGFIGAYDGKDWWGHHDLDPWSTPTSETIRGIWGTAKSDIFAVGEGGVILHFDGSSWSGMTSPTTETLKDVWGAASDDVYAVGNNGTVLHYDGTEWSIEDVDATENLKAIWGTDADNIYIVGTSGTVLHSLSMTQYSIWCDPDTGLCWQDPQRKAYDTSDIGLRSKEAIQYCQDLQLGGYDDWRLPTIDELRTILDGCPTTETGGSCGVVSGSSKLDGYDLNCIGGDMFGGPGANGCYFKQPLTGTCDKIDLFSEDHHLETWAVDEAADDERWIGSVLFENGGLAFNHICSLGDVRCVRDAPSDPVTCVESGSCQPGDTRPCSCDGYEQPDGYQVCSDGGNCWGPCECTEITPDPSITPECDNGRCPDSDKLELNITTSNEPAYEPHQLVAFYYKLSSGFPPIGPPDGGTYYDQIIDPGMPPYTVIVPGCTYYGEYFLDGQYRIYSHLQMDPKFPPIPEDDDYVIDNNTFVTFPLGGDAHDGDVEQREVILKLVGGCPAETPHKCESNGECVADPADCCPLDQPFRCWDGTCAASPDDCPSPIDCGECPEPCPDDSNVFSCRYSSTFTENNCADFPPKYGWPSEDTPENREYIRSICASQQGADADSVVVSFGSTCRYEKCVDSTCGRCTFNSDGKDFYATGIPSIGCSMGGGSDFQEDYVCEDFN